ncbi:organic solute transporter Ostalpha-domain-containing protein [Xylaria palmicola]|nr:organic solute transporter Ostalpha-domain-containing protein [Xylaria palmicola]
MGSWVTLSLRNSDTKSTCKLPSPLVPIPTEPIAGSRDLYHVNVIVSGALALFSTLAVLALIWRHATNMSRPREQLYIIRICLLLPILAIALWAGIYVPRAYVYLYSVVVICESVTLTCFFLFICETLAAPLPTSTSTSTSTSAPAPASASTASSSSPPSRSRSRSRRAVFLSPLTTQARQLGVVAPTDDARIFGLFRRRFIGVAQGIPVAWAVAAAAVASEAAGVYCLTAHDARHAHTYLVVLKTVSTFVALLSVLRATLPVQAEVRRHRAMTKLWAFKALIFLQVTQDFVFSIVNSNAPRSITESKTVSQIDFLTGIPSLIVEIELVVFALFFHYAYSVSVYQLSDEQKRAGGQYASYGWRLVYKIFDIRDVFALIKFAFHVRQEAEKHEMEMLYQSMPVSELTQSHPPLAIPTYHFTPPFAGVVLHAPELRLKGGGMKHGNSQKPIS